MISMVKTTPDVTFRVIDAETRQPIKNIEVSLRWFGYVPAVVDTLSHTYGEQQYGLHNPAGVFHISGLRTISSPMIFGNEVWFEISVPGYCYQRLESYGGFLFSRKWDARTIELYSETVEEKTVEDILKEIESEEKE